jgi:eukaryotic-like serine/threonine-protein kinase
MIGKILGHYQITSEIGKGGMGEVYQAKDRKLGRDVAIKVLPEEFARDADRVARFKREAKVLASLNHPNIATIHGLEEYGGTNFLVLELVEGQNLADRIKNGAIPVEEALKLALQTAEALEAAHEKGIIHRDLKPSNIMVTDKGSVKLLDFGLAKLYEQDAAVSQLPTADYPATQAGAILGTVAYMSPEQAQGQSADARSDIFSFGLVLYEMLSGRKAFTGDSTPAIMAALLRDNPSALQTSPSIEKLVQKCLAKQPSGRHQAISEVKTALERIFAEKPNIAAAEMQPSIAVLPFVNMSGDKEQEYFSDGLAEEIINALTQIPKLKVTARTSAFAFRGKEQDITKIADTLHVRTILEGSVRKSGNRVRITAQLINAADGYHLWSERYDREMTDVFAIQDEICRAIVDKLRVQLATDRPIVKRHTENLEAYSLYLKGHYNLYKGTPDGMAKGKEYFEQALAIDPNYALALFGLADFYFSMGFLGYFPPNMAWREAGKFALKALEFDDALPAAHALMASLRAMEYDWKGAEKEFHRALDLGPNSEEARIYYCLYFLIPTRRIAEAIDVWRKALDLDPLSPFIQYGLGYTYYLIRKWDQAIEQCRNALEIDPHHYLAHQYLGFTYLQIGRIDEGMRECEIAAERVGRSHWAFAFRAIAYACAGHFDEARRVLDGLQQFAKESSVSPSTFAWIYCSLGDIDKGLEWFENAIDTHDGLISHGHIFPIYDVLRSHPRYPALLRKMNLEP